MKKKTIITIILIVILVFNIIPNWVNTEDNVINEVIDEPTEERNDTQYNTYQYLKLKSYVFFYNHSGAKNYTLLFHWIFIDIMEISKGINPYYTIKWEYFKPYKIISEGSTVDMNGTYKQNYKSFIDSDYVFKISIGMWIPYKLLGQIKYDWSMNLAYPQS